MEVVGISEINKYFQSEWEKGSGLVAGSECRMNEVFNRPKVADIRMRCAWQHGRIESSADWGPEIVVCRRASITLT